MEYVLNLMEKELVVGPVEIARFKQYISKKYAEATSAYRAEVLANSIRRVLQKHMDGIRELHWAPIQDALLRSTVEKDDYRISKLDIFNKLLELPLAMGELTANVSCWLNQNVSPAYTPGMAAELVRSCLKERKSRNLRVLTQAEIASAATGAAAEALFPRTNGVLRAKSSGSRTQAIGDRPFVAASALVEKTIQQAVEGRIALTNQISAFTQAKTQKKRNMAWPDRSLWAGGLSVAVMLLVLIHSFTTMELSYSEIKAESNKTPLFAYGVPVSADESFPQELIADEGPQFVLEEDHIQLKGAIFAYSDFDMELLRERLLESNSLLAEDPYFSTIIETAKAHKIDARLLFAITAQEQGLVPRDRGSAVKIANNPFNVFGSWQKYNTTILDSCDIVCNTIVNRMGKLPEGTDPYLWLNASYAGDPNWYKGVHRFYDEFVALSKLQ